MTPNEAIRTPDQRLRVFVSSTLGELAAERAAARAGIEALHLVPVMFELGARPHPPRELYRAYLEQSHVFVGVYWQRYGWVAPGESVSGLEDEYRAAGDRPKLLYIKEPAPDREPELVRLLAEIKADDRASYKRFASPEELAELVQRDLALLLTERFEAARTSTSEAGASVPSQDATDALTPIIGRDTELAELADLVGSGPRLVTITGPGGVGKSRLATAVAARVRHDFPHGTHTVLLASITDPELVLPTIADRLGVRLDGQRRPVDALADHLTGRRALLVLDNLEQVVAVAPNLRALLERLPDLRMLATSRRPLGIVGEQVWPLAPLPLPAVDGDERAILDSASVELFVQRARAVDPSFHLDPAGVAAVAELCRRLDGLPLAIELAAARVRLLPPAALLRRLGHQLDLLLVGGSDRPERQRTLSATIDWSVRLLTSDEQALFARLSVFSGGATLPAIEAVCDIEGGGRSIEVVASLLDHGLVATADAGAEHEPRITMLETVRAEAAQRLQDRGETDLLRHHHLTWFAELADEAQPHLCGPDQVRWLERMDPERANLRAAAATGLASGRVATVLEMAWDVYIYYQLRGAYDEPATWVSEVARHPARLEQLDERQRAVATTATAIAALSAGPADQSRIVDDLQGALATFERVGATFEQAVAEMHLGLCALATSRWPAAISAERAALEHFSAVGHDWGVGSSENLLGVALASVGDREAARAAHDRALTAGQRISNPTISAQALVLLAELALDDGDVDLASEHLADAAPLLIGARDAIGASSCLEVVAALALARSDPQTASVALGAAAETRRRIGSPLNLVLRDRVDRLRAAVSRRAGEGFEPALARGAATDVFEVLDAIAVGRQSSAAASRASLVVDVEGDRQQQH